MATHHFRHFKNTWNHNWDCSVACKCQPTTTSLIYASDLHFVFTVGHVYQTQLSLPLSLNNLIQRGFFNGIYTRECGKQARLKVVCIMCLCICAIYKPLTSLVSEMQKEASVLDDGGKQREGEASVCPGRGGQMDDGSSIPGLPLKTGAHPGERAPSSPWDTIIEENASDANINPNYFDG